MKQIVFPLKPQMKRPDVAHLHKALRLLDLTIYTKGQSRNEISVTAQVMGRMG